MIEIWKDIRNYEGLYKISSTGRVLSFKCGKEKILKYHITYRGYLCVRLYKNKKSNCKTIHRLVFETFKEKIKKDYIVHHINEYKEDNYYMNLEQLSKDEHGKKHPHSIETKKLLRELRIGKTQSNETKIKISKANKGRITSEETKIKISKANKGRIVSNETKRKIGLTSLGRIKSEKTIKLMRENNIGENNPMFGKHQSEKTKKLISDKMIGKYRGENSPTSTLKNQDVIKIRLLSDEGILTQTEIGEKFGVNHRTISAIKLRKTWKHI